MQNNASPPSTDSMVDLLFGCAGCNPIQNGLDLRIAEPISRRHEIAIGLRAQNLLHEQTVFEVAGLHDWRMIASFHDRVITGSVPTAFAAMATEAHRIEDRFDISREGAGGTARRQIG